MALVLLQGQSTLAAADSTGQELHRPRFRPEYEKSPRGY